MCLTLILPNCELIAISKFNHWVGLPLPEESNILWRNNLLALKASDSSMNKANIGGRSVDDGDYVIARREDNYCPKNGDHVISIIGGAANLKKFRKDTKNRQIILESESTEDLPPIVISEQDINNLSAYSIAAKAVAVVKTT